MGRLAVGVGSLQWLRFPPTPNSQRDDYRTLPSGASFVAIAFGLSERAAGELITMTHGSDVEALRWVVFGSNPAELSQLDTRWNPHIDLTLVLLPGMIEDVLDATLTILEAESISARESVWIQGAGASLVNSSEFGFVVDARERDSQSVVSELRQWVSTRCTDQPPRL